jgi:ABC-2 type transport system ATP-binding protein
LLAGTGTIVRAARDDAALARVLRAAGLEPRETADGLLVDAAPEIVGEAALYGGVALRELRAAEGSGLEQLFFELTSGDADAGAADAEPADEPDALEAIR